MDYQNAGNILTSKAFCGVELNIEHKGKNGSLWQFNNVLIEAGSPV